MFVLFYRPSNRVNPIEAISYLTVEITRQHLLNNLKK